MNPWKLLILAILLVIGIATLPYTLPKWYYNSWLKNLPAELDENLAQITKLEKDLTILDSSYKLRVLSKRLHSMDCRLISYKKQLGPDFTDDLIATGKFHKTMAEIVDAFDFVQKFTKIVEKALAEKARTHTSAEIRSELENEIAQIKEDHKLEIKALEWRLRTIDHGHKEQKLYLFIIIAMILLFVLSMGSLAGLAWLFDDPSYRENRKWAETFPDLLDEYLARITKLEAYLTILDPSDHMANVSTTLNSTKLLLTNYKHQLGPYLLNRRMVPTNIAQIREEMENVKRTVQECTEDVEEAVMERLGAQKEEIAQIKEDHRVETAQKDRALRKVSAEKMVSASLRAELNEIRAKNTQKTGQNKIEKVQKHLKLAQEELFQEFQRSLNLAPICDSSLEKELEKKAQVDDVMAELKMERDMLQMENEMLKKFVAQDN